MFPQQFYHFPLRFELICMFFTKLFLGLETNRVHWCSPFSFSSRLCCDIITHAVLAWSIWAYSVWDCSLTSFALLSREWTRSAYTRPTAVWKIDNKKWMISYRQVVKPATPSNLSNIVANEEKNDTNMISWQDQCCLFALICFRFLSFVFYRAKYVATVFLCHHSPTLCFLVFFLEYLNIPRWLTLTFD